MKKSNFYFRYRNVGVLPCSLSILFLHYIMEKGVDYFGIILVKMSNFLLFSVNVEHKKTSVGIDVTDLKDLFGWLEEQGASVDPLKKFLEYQNSLLLAGETLDFAMSEHKMTQKEIEDLADKLFDKNISDRLKKVEERAKR